MKWPFAPIIVMVILLIVVAFNLYSIDMNVTAQHKENLRLLTENEQLKERLAELKELWIEAEENLLLCQTFRETH